jgi:hypothetical protein
VVLPHAACIQTDAPHCPHSPHPPNWRAAAPLHPFPRRSRPATTHDAPAWHATASRCLAGARAALLLTAACAATA